MGADLDWREVSLLRSIGRYLRQVGITYSQSYFAQALSSNVDIARHLVQLFRTRFDPGVVSIRRRVAQRHRVGGQDQEGAQRRCQP